MKRNKTASLRVANRTLSEYIRSAIWRHNAVTCSSFSEQKPPLQRNFHATGGDTNTPLFRQNFMNEPLSRRTRDARCVVTDRAAPSYLQLPVEAIKTIRLAYRKKGRWRYIFGKIVMRLAAVSEPQEVRAITKLYSEEFMYSLNSIFYTLFPWLQIQYQKLHMWCM
jgi:hypothetical protein